MPTFTNQATLSYNGASVLSNVVTGEILETLEMRKTVLDNEYSRNENMSYVISLVNSGATDLTDITVTDNLGGYTVGTTTVYPLTYLTNSVKYYVNGVLQGTPTVTAGPPLAFSGITVPANGNAVIAYEAVTNEFAPLAPDSTILNTATATGASLATPLTASETILADGTPNLNITKSVSPNPVTENGQITYTFVIENSGNTPVNADANAVVSDTFNPILRNLTATYNGNLLTPTTNYTYNEATGAFSTVAGLITVPAATYTQNPTTGVITTTPGQSVLTVTGTI